SGQRPETDEGGSWRQTLSDLRGDGRHLRGGRGGLTVGPTRNVMRHVLGPRPENMLFAGAYCAAARAWSSQPSTRSRLSAIHWAAWPSMSWSPAFISAFWA